MSHERYLKAAEGYLAAHYPDAECAFVAGSVMRGEGYENSDVDLVVLYKNEFEDVHRRADIYEGIHIEVFVQNVQAQNYFMDENRKRGVPSMCNMVFEGHVLGANLALAEQQKQRAGRILNQGPPELSEAEFDRARYMITDMIDDFIDDRPQDQIIAIAAELYNVLGGFYLRAQGEWSGRTKGLLKRMKAVDPDTAERLTSAYIAIVAGDKAPLITLCEDILEPYGGRYWEGDKQSAPDDWRAFKDS